MTKQSIWDMAIAHQAEKHQNTSSTTLTAQHKETTLLFVGSRNVGKTTLIHRFLEKQETSKPTLALEYTFGRKTNQNLAKDVCHIWELGGGTTSIKLLETPLSASKLLSLHVILMVDLSEPYELWFTLETIMSSLHTHVQHSFKSQEAKDQNLQETLMNSLNKDRVDSDHPDLEATEPFPLPIVILGGKYDLFQNMEPEKKKIVCKALRFFCHFYGATLQFYSAKDAGLVKKARDLLSHHAFNTEPGKGMSQDYNKPLIIPAWSDSFEAISGGSSGSSSGGRQNLEMWKHQFTTHFPQSVSERTALPEDPAKDPNFEEPMIDQVRAQKDEDLERYRREIERRNRQWGDYFDQSVKY